MILWELLRYGYKKNRAWAGFVILRKILNSLQRRIYLYQLMRSAPNHFVHFFLKKHFHHQRVLFITHKFLDFNGNEIYLGGAERYLIELAQVVRETGYEPLIVQGGSQNWLHFYQGIWVIGLDIRPALWDPTLLVQVLEILQPEAKLLIYSPFSLYTPKLNIPAIGISHGIYWDNSQTSRGFEARFKRLTTSVEGLDLLVSVDTATINWIRTINTLLVKRTKYVPNFVDLETFKPKPFSNKGQITILYPRRLYPPRGFWLVAECLPEILQLYPHVEFEFVGQADTEERKKVQEWLESFPGRVKWYSLPPDRMVEAYDHADIVLIPSLHSEGTSLSCLEAMASGKSVIATNVGGLPDLIIDGYNGLLVNPDSNSLKQAIERLIKDHKLREKLGNNAHHVAEAFGIEHWRDRWRRVIISKIPAQKPIRRSQTVIFPYTGISWGNMVQRPHHLAIQLANRGYEVFWINPEEEGAQYITPHLHVIPISTPFYITESEPILWIYYPFAYEEIKKYEHPLVVYDVLDDIAIFDEISPEVGQKAREYQKNLLERADVVITSARVLLEQFRTVRPDIIWVPNGVDTAHFNPRRRGSPPFDFLLQKPVIGYHGALASWFDSELLAQVARLRPNYTFVLVGPLSDDTIRNNLQSLPNVYFTGTQPYDKLPELLAWFDVGIIPFKVCEVTHAVRPLKALENLSMGIPVVSTPLKEILDLPGVLIGETPEEFANQVDIALSQAKKITETKEVRKLLEISRWDQVAKPLIEIIEKKTSQRKQEKIRLQRCNSQSPN